MTCASYISALGTSTIVSVRLPDDTEAELSAFYAAAANRAGMALTVNECDRLALAFQLPLDAIEEVTTLVALGNRKPASPADDYERVARACRRIASPKLTQLAQRMEPAFSLEQLILPAEQHQQLQEVVSNVTNATTVLKKWGFDAQLPYGSGVVALFSGPSGTGKTMAAQAIARELRTEVFAVDLSRVVSKYIGETEKNLDAVFTEAERANALLLINEAECTVSQRGEQKDAHDRYANLEIAYLLQRMESFSGLAILTTNFKQNIDQAFLRRLRFVIDFPEARCQGARGDLAPVPAKCGTDRPGRRFLFPGAAGRADRRQYQTDHIESRVCGRKRRRCDRDAAHLRRNAGGAVETGRQRRHARACGSRDVPRKRPGGVRAL